MTTNPVPFVDPEIATALNLYPDNDRPRLIGYWRDSASTRPEDTRHGKQAAASRAQHEKIVASGTTGGYSVTRVIGGELVKVSALEYTATEAERHARLAVLAARLPWPGDHCDPSMPADERERVAAALDAAPIVTRYCGSSWDRLSGDRSANGSGERSFAGFAWPEGLSTYVRRYGLRLPEAFLHAIGVRD